MSLRAGVRGVVLAACLAGAGSHARAQGATPPRTPPGTASFPRAHSLEIDAGDLWVTGVHFGTADANETKNQSARTPYTLFSTSSSLASTFGTELRVGVAVSHVMAVEAGFEFARPTLETAISADVEGVPATTAHETLSRFAFDGSAVLHLVRFRLGRGVPFVLGGAGYLRELHQGNALVETGRTFHAGGGLKIPLVLRRGFVRTIGLRVDGRIYWRSGGADLDEAEPARTFGAGGASLIVGF